MKKTYKKHSLILCLLTLCLALSCWIMPIHASAEAVSEFDCTYSVSKDKPYLQYGSSEVITYTSQEAAAAGIPEGYNDTVVSVKPLSGASSGCGILLDFSALNAPVALVEQLSFRFYLGENEKNTNGKPQLRIISPTTGHWVYQPGTTASVTGQWATETVKNENSLFNDLANEEGYLDKFELSLRVSAHIDFYIDSITVKMAENDGVAPEILCEDGDTVTVSLGSSFTLNASAYDAQEGCEKPLEYIWENGVVLDENGTPNAVGEYLLTLRAVDIFGNVSEKTITVTVTEPDLEGPVIYPNFTKMYAQVGMIPLLNFQVRDNQKVVEVSYVWSEGALNAKGALTEGTHTYTITAKDDSGNVTVHTITVFVTKDEPAYDNVIDEEQLSPRFIVTFDGENSKTYKYGEKVKEPADPVREDSENFTYVFEGWYNGEVAWDFDKDVVLEHINLVSKWTQIPHPQDSTSDSDQSSDEVEDSTSSDEVEDSTSSDEKEDDSSVSSNSGKPGQSSDKDNASSSNNSQQDQDSDKDSSTDDNKQNILSGCFGTMSVGILLPILLGGCIVYKRKNNKEE